MVGMEMYVEIQKLKKLGYKKQRAARQLGLDTKTVRKYWDMGEDEYVAQRLESQERTKGMDLYRGYVLEKLHEHREITSAILYDNLREDFEDFSPSYRSVRRYVSMLRESEGLLAPGKIRQYMEVQENPPGFQAQVDMGQKTMRDAFGQGVKVYIFAMVLSNSRYKYVCFQTEPFTARTFCEAHDAAFRYFGGRPVEIVYDQDRVMVVSENGGDIIYTEAFESYKNYAGFSVHLCRGNDPESKGKIEAVIKYVKGNFLSCRVFHGAGRLNSDGLLWLERTGNGMVHETTKLVPKAAFAQEQRYLKPVPTLGDIAVLPKVAIVRKNNVVMYRQNRYCMPQGTYRPGRRARIEADEQQNVIRFFDHESGELLEQLPLAQGIGQCIRNAHPGRDKKTQHKKLLDQALEKFGQDEQAVAFLEGMLALKPRYTRDQLCMVIRLQEQYSPQELSRAASYCVERELFTATDFGDTLEYFAIKQEPYENTGIKLPVKYRVVTAQQRPLEAYAALVKGGEAL
ncbi:IS21 family transposase [Clostridia bacterium OttesenSCG-928-O13]|nr:IS21 family transposase [Clostridia bacterium OttesenSCG-928-O13]